VRGMQGLAASFRCDEVSSDAILRANTWHLQNNLSAPAHVHVKPESLCARALHALRCALHPRIALAACLLGPRNSRNAQSSKSWHHLRKHQCINRYCTRLQIPAEISPDSSKPATPLKQGV
jgi:hypothetical protein